jgi:hypothetical protein
MSRGHVFRDPWVARTTVARLSPRKALSAMLSAGKSWSAEGPLSPSSAGSEVSRLLVPPRIVGTG